MKWACNCGQVTAEVADGKGTRITCYCASCRGFAERYGAGGHLDEAGGVDLLQLAPEDVSNLTGQEHLQWFRMTEKGPLRWVASCCGTPFCNTLSSPKIPFMTLMAWQLADPAQAGRTVAKVNLSGATTHIKGDLGSPRRAIFAFMKRALWSRLSGGYKRNTLFNGDGTPIGSQVTAAPAPPPGELT